ncbi:hypothetical protein F511_38167 [Dorcoceras hygrometricum]|uniref:Uncharacterized protein n=1 Tax=Dorcoceras hygrometricum TaxID=472368 RepID=A0A2Z7CDN0_9LAMI|nr:hypothetical protein F511_38167 [Dorcoceras hygrometricum]
MDRVLGRNDQLIKQFEELHVVWDEENRSKLLELELPKLRFFQILVSTARGREQRPPFRGQKV